MKVKAPAMHAKKPSLADYFWPEGIAFYADERATWGKRLQCFVVLGSSIPLPSCSSSPIHISILVTPGIPISKSFFKLPAAGPGLPTIHLFPKLPSPVTVVFSRSHFLTAEDNFVSTAIPLTGTLNAEGMCGITRSTDLVPAEAEYVGSCRGSNGRVTNS